MFARDNYRCQVCGLQFSPTTDPYDGKEAPYQDGVTLWLGHIVSRRNGGQYTESNLRAECSTCNMSQGSRNAPTYATEAERVAARRAAERKRQARRRRALMKQHERDHPVSYAAPPD